MKKIALFAWLLAACLLLCACSAGGASGGGTIQDGAQSGVGDEPQGGSPGGGESGGASGGEENGEEESGSPGSGESGEESDSPGSGEGGKSGENVMYLKVNGNVARVLLEENSSAEAFCTRLGEGDVTVEMDDYGDFEKVGDLGFTLPRNDARITTRPGDVILYQGSSVTVYYDVNTWSFTRLGTIEGVSTREEALALLGGAGRVTVTFSLHAAP